MPGKQANKQGNSSCDEQKNPTGQRKLSKKKSIEDYAFYIGSSKQDSDFETTYKYVTNHTKNTSEKGHDIVKKLRNLRRPDMSQWKPTLSTSASRNAEMKAQEDKQFEIQYKAELDKMMKRKWAFQDNTFK
eukprot:11781629-Ditylum_brightwellii.AAC.1